MNPSLPHPLFDPLFRLNVPRLLNKRSQLFRHKSLSEKQLVSNSKQAFKIRKLISNPPVIQLEGIKQFISVITKNRRKISAFGGKWRRTGIPRLDVG